MTSAWEILNPSNLKYDIAFEVIGEDSGSGPPTVYGGWIRTGYVANTGNFFGIGNCNV